MLEVAFSQCRVLARTATSRDFMSSVTMTLTSMRATSAPVATLPPATVISAQRAAWASMPVAIGNASRRHGIEKKVPKEATARAPSACNIVKNCSFAPGYCAVQPPSTEIAVPVIWSAAGEHRKATVPPSCAGDTKSKDGSFSARSALSASFWLMCCSAAMSLICFSTKGVRTQPGQTVLQVTPLPAVSRPTTLVRPTSPCLAAT